MLKSRDLCICDLFESNLSRNGFLPLRRLSAFRASTGEDTPSITQDPAFIFIPFCGEREAKAD